uniref:Uncharacterized protein n=1 Tax=Anguilla anguilla TaxID=7936 RepID=A0A0E9SRP6_ANGAN
MNDIHLLLLYRYFSSCHEQLSIAASASSKIIFVSRDLHSDSLQNITLKLK